MQMEQIRFSGLASGMDTESIVEKLMKAERMPLNRMEQEKQWLEWKRDDYREMNRLLSELDELIFNGIDREKTFIDKNVTSSNESVATATATPNAPEVSTTINVSQVAKAASWRTDDLTTLPNNPLDTGWNASKTNATFDAEGNTTLSFTITKQDSSTEVVEININKDDTIDEVISKINNSDLGVSAIKGQFDDGDSGTADTPVDRIVLLNNETGASFAEIKANDTNTRDFMNDLGFTNNAQDADGKYSFNTDNVIDGQNAEFTVNGFTTVSKTNSFDANGIHYNIYKTGSANISTSINTGKAFDAITEFVEKYNEVIEKINEEIGEKRYRDYKPLTAKQKEAMSEEEIKLWEEKARSGTLRNDFVLSNGLNDMRLDLYSPVEGITTSYDSLADIGITTSSNYLDNGKLEINESDLRNALENDPNAVYELFNKEADPAIADKRREDRTPSEQRTFDRTSGIVERLRDTIDETMENIVEKAGNKYMVGQNFTIGRLINDVDERMIEFEERLIDIENRYWREFTRMEQAMQRANQQSTYLMQQLGL